MATAFESATTEPRPTGRPVTAAETRSVGELLRDLADDFTQLIRGELRLARAEAGEKVHQMMLAILSIAAGIVLALAALIILLNALVYALAEIMPPWLAAVIVGGVVAIIGLALVMGGQKALSASELVPDRTARSLQRDIDVVKGHVT